MDNTDAEGRLLLGDCLSYAQSEDGGLGAHSIVDVATLTGAMAVALGAGAAGVFTTSQRMWEGLKNAGNASGDPFWRMPLDPHYDDMMRPKVGVVIGGVVVVMLYSL